MKKVVVRRKPVVSEEVVDREENRLARINGIDNSKPAGKIAKTVSIVVSIGDEDRKRPIEKFIGDILETLAAVEYGKSGIHAMVLSSNYIIDGKTCLPGDYDQRKENFADGALPPVWAGGPAPSRIVVQDTSGDAARGISAKTYDAKYPGGSPHKAPTIKKSVEESEIEFDWDVEDALDDAKLSKVKNTRIVRRSKPVPDPPKKRVVVRRKK